MTAKVSAIDHILAGFARHRTVQILPHMQPARQQQLQHEKLNQPRNSL